MNRYSIWDHDYRTDLIVRPRGLASLDMTCRKQDAEDDKNATHRSLSGGPHPKRTGRQVRREVDAGGPAGVSARAAVAPWLCVTAFRRFCSEQRSCFPTQCRATMQTFCFGGSDLSHGIAGWGIRVESH